MPDQERLSSAIVSATCDLDKGKTKTQVAAELAARGMSADDVAVVIEKSEVLKSKNDFYGMLFGAVVFLAAAIGKWIFQQSAPIYLIAVFFGIWLFIRNFIRLGRRTPP